MRGRRGSTMLEGAFNAAPDTSGLTATAAKVCSCSNGNTVNCSGGACPSGPVRTYVQVTVQTTVSAMFTYPQLGYTGAAIATAKMRAQ